MIMKIKQDISIGDNLRTLRKKAGLSQEEVAVKLQVLGQSISREIISQMECGKHSIRISVGGLCHTSLSGGQRDDV